MPGCKNTQYGLLYSRECPNKIFIKKANKTIDKPINRGLVLNT